MAASFTTGSYSDQSSNSPGCSQVLQYISRSTDSLPPSASLNRADANGADQRSLAMHSAHHSAINSSLSTEETSVVAGNATFAQVMNVKADSWTSNSPVSYSVGLPASPLSFSSSNNTGMSGSSGMTFSHQGVTTVAKAEPPQDPSFHPAKLLKTETGHWPTAPAHAPQNFSAHYSVNNLANFSQGVNSNPAMRMAQTKGHVFAGSGQGFSNNEQPLPQLYKPVHDISLQQPVVQTRFHRPQLQEHALLQQQPLHLAQLLQQRLIQQEQIRRMLPSQIQQAHLLQQKHNLQKLQNHNQRAKQAEMISAGGCSKQLMQYLYHQRLRPADNNIQFWRDLISKYFAPSSRKRWCLSKCFAGRDGHRLKGTFPQELWCCELCGSSPGRGFEATFEIMPRLCKTKFDSGELDELLYVEFPNERKLQSGVTILEYNRAIQENVYNNIRVVWEGQLRIAFNIDGKIISWDFCAKNREELVSRRSIVPQIRQLVAISFKCQSAMGQGNGHGVSAADLQKNCNMFLSSARHLAMSLEPPQMNELGFTKRFVRCIQVAEVVKSMKDLMDFSRDNNLGPIESLLRYPHGRSSVEVSDSIRQADSGEIDAAGSEQVVDANGIYSNMDNNNINGASFNGPINSLQDSELPNCSNLPNFSSNLASSHVNSSTSTGVSGMTSVRVSRSTVTTLPAQYNLEPPTTTNYEAFPALLGCDFDSINPLIDFQPIDQSGSHDFMQGLMNASPSDGQMFQERKIKNRREP